MYVDEVRIQNALPLGKPAEWSEGMTTPVDVSITPQLPADYPIYTMDFSDFLKISAKDLQDISRNYPAIVVSGRPTRLKCDLESLEEWGGVDELRVMHGNIFFQWLFSSTDSTPR